MNKNLEKTKLCLQWMEDNYYPDGGMTITQPNNSTLTYKDSEDELCILRFGPDTISFDGQFYTFDQFLELLTDNDDYTMEIMLSEINLNF